MGPDDLHTDVGVCVCGKLKQGRQRYPGGGGGEREFSRQKENKCKIEVIKMANTK